MPTDFFVNNYKKERYWIPFNLLNGRSYKVLKAEVLLNDFYRYKIPLMEWDKKTVYYCGVEGSGKTNAIRFMTWVLNKIDKYVEEGLISVLTNDIRILGDKRYSYLWEDIVFINLPIDDAMGAVGTDSVDYMTKEGKAVSKEFVTSRHIGEEEINKVGVVFMSFATQVYKRLSPVIRDNATLKIFTSYMDTDDFNRLFPYEESEFMREMHHYAHVSTDWRKRCYLMCRTGAAEIATIRVPFVPRNQYELNFCRHAKFFNEEKKCWEPYFYPGEFVEEIVETITIHNEKEFRKHKSHYNKIYLIDRSIDQKTIITRLANYLHTQPTINYLIEHHPKRNSLEDFSRGKLYGYLRDEAERIVDEYCTDISKSDMLTAIEQALKEEDIELVKKMKKGEIIFEEPKEKEDDSNLSQIKAAFKSNLKKKIYHILEITEQTGLERKQVGGILSCPSYQDLFINIIPYQGFWSYKKNLPSEQELSDFMEEHQIKIKKEVKKLVMT